MKEFLFNQTQIAVICCTKVPFNQVVSYYKQLKTQERKSTEFSREMNLGFNLINIYESYIGEEVDYV